MGRRTSATSGPRARRCAPGSRRGVTIAGRSTTSTTAPTSRRPSSTTGPGPSSRRGATSRSRSSWLAATRTPSPATSARRGSGSRSASSSCCPSSTRGAPFACCISTCWSCSRSRSRSSSSTRARSSGRSRSSIRSSGICSSRMLVAGFRPRERSGPLIPVIPVRWLAIAAIVLAVFRIGMNVVDSQVIDIGFANVVGADRIADGEGVYDGQFTPLIDRGDSYGPFDYISYIPFEQLLPVGRRPREPARRPPRRDRLRPRGRRAAAARRAGDCAPGSRAARSGSRSPSPGSPTPTPSMRSMPTAATTRSSRRCSSPP